MLEDRSKRDQVSVGVKAAPHATPSTAAERRAIAGGSFGDPGTWPAGNLRLVRHLIPRLAYTVFPSPVNSPDHPLQLLDPAIPPPAHQLPSQPVHRRLFIAFVITELGRPRVVLTDDSLEGGLSTETELQQEVVSNQCFMCFNQLDSIRKPMRNTQHKGIALCVFPLLQAMRGFPRQALGGNHPRPLVPHPQWTFSPRHAVEAQFVCSIRLPSPPGRSDRLGEAD